MALLSRSSGPYTDLNLDISRRQVVLHEPFCKHGNGPTGTNGYPVWPLAADYSYLTVAQQLYVSSSSTDDTSAGTGLRSMRIIGIGSAGQAVEEVVVLNGQAAVQTVNPYFRINRARPVTCGAVGSNAGTVYIGTEDAPASGVPAEANTLATVSPLRGSTEQLLYTVPNGYTLYVSGFVCDAGRSPNASVGFDLYVRENIRDANGAITVIGPWFVVSGTSAYGNESHVDYWRPLRVTQNSDIKVTSTSTGTAQVRVILDATLIGAVDALVTNTDMGI
jgi:hypothetical protein